MDIQKVAEIVTDAVTRLSKEAGCSTHTYTLRVPASAKEVHVLIFSDSHEACNQALDTIRIAAK